MNFRRVILTAALTAVAAVAQAAPVVVQKGSISGYVYIPGTSVATSGSGSTASAAPVQTCQIDVSASPDTTFTIPSTAPTATVTFNYRVVGGGGGAGGWGFRPWDQTGWPGSPGQNGGVAVGSFTAAKGDTIRFVAGGGGGAGSSPYPYDNGNRRNYAIGGAGGAGYFGGGGGAGTDYWGDPNSIGIFRGTGGGGGGSSVILQNGTVIAIAKGGDGGAGGNGSTGGTANGGTGGSISAGLGAANPGSYYSTNTLAGYAGYNGGSLVGGYAGSVSGASNSYTCGPGVNLTRSACAGSDIGVRSGGGGGSLGGGGGSSDVRSGYGYEGSNFGASFTDKTPPCVNNSSAGSSNCYASRIASTFNIGSVTAPAITTYKIPSGYGVGGKLNSNGNNPNLVNQAGFVAEGGSAGYVLLTYSAGVCYM